MTQDGLKLIGVYDRGVPNLERVVIFSSGPVQLRTWFIGIGMRNGANSIDPINDNSFWMGNGLLFPGDWVFVYTGGGKPSSNDIPNQTNKIHTLHWNRRSVLFSSSEIFPYLSEIGSVVLPEDMNFPSTEAITQNQ